MNDILQAFGIQWSSLLAQVVNFCILVFVLARFVYKPVLKVVDERRSAIAESMEKVKEIELARNLTGAIGGKTIVIKAKASKSGKLYAAITATEVAAAIKEYLSAEIATDAISFAAPIKTIGDHTVKIAVVSQETEMKIKVEAVE